MGIYFGYATYFLIPFFPICVSYFLYYHEPGMASYSRFKKTVLLILLSFFACDLLGVIFIRFSAAFWDTGIFLSTIGNWGVLISATKVPLIASAIPFYYLSTKYWDSADTEHKNSAIFGGIQFIGLYIGLFVGAATLLKHSFMIKFGLFSWFFLPDKLF